MNVVSHKTSAEQLENGGQKLSARPRIVAFKRQTSPDSNRNNLLQPNKIVDLVPYLSEEARRTATEESEIRTNSLTHTAKKYFKVLKNYFGTYYENRPSTLLRYVSFLEYSRVGTFNL
jgi:hypothetical protein